MANSNLKAEALIAREYLLDCVLQFTLRARVIPGVTRIAMIGSLVTAKPEPKDADVLITVEDSVDFKVLADVGRKLQGAANQRGKGADIFVAGQS